MRRIALASIALALLAAVGLAGAWYWNERRTGDVRGSASSEFAATEAPGATTRRRSEVEEEPWPTFGFDPARTKFAPEFALRPPFRRLWMVRGRSLLEFPPVVAYGRVYLATDAGRLLAVEATTGEVVWEKNLGLCLAASPAVGDGVVYQTYMDPYPCRKHVQDAPGFLVAFDADTGKELWRFRSGVTESSPLLVDGVVYFGSWDRKIYAIDARTRKVRWTHETGDKIKGGAAYDRGSVFVGSYDGKVYALDARTGKLRWASEA